MTRLAWVTGAIAACTLLLGVILLRERVERGDGADAPSILARRPDAATAPEFRESSAQVAEGGAAPTAIAPVESAVPGVQEAEATFVVRHADGVPARGCVVVLLAGDDIAWSALANEEGIARGNAVAGPVVAWVGGATLVPIAFPVDGARGRRELVLPVGEVIDGRVVVDGGPPPEPIPLGLASDHEVLDLVPQAVQSRMRRAATSAGVSVDGCGALVGLDGIFRFSGLPSGWAGQFDCADGYTVDDPRELEAVAPEHGRILRLHRIPHIRFRVVSAGERAPVPFATGLTTVFGAQNGASTTIACDADGRAEVRMLRWEPALSIQLDLADAAGVSRVQARFDIQDASRDLDLGDIELGTRWSIAFHVTEPGGTPLAGAVGATECGTSLRSEPTDAAGLGRLDGVEPGCGTIRFGAPRHEPTSLPLPAQPPSAPLEVSLAPCAWLDVLVSSSDGEPRDGLALVMHTERHVSSQDHASDFQHSALRFGIPFHLGSYGRDERIQPDGSVLELPYSKTRISKLGAYEIGCMEPEAPIGLKLIDRSDFIVWSDACKLDAGEQRQVAAVVSSQPQTLHVLVTDQAGAPVDEAELSVHASAGAAEFVGGAMDQEATDAEGRAAFENVYAPAVDLHCELRGYVTADTPALAPGTLAHVVLMRGSAVTLHVADAGGRPAMADAAWAGVEDGAPEGEAVDETLDPDSLRRSSTTWQFEELVPGPVTFVVDVGGREFTLEHDSRLAEATLVVPAFGSVMLRGLQSAKDKPDVHVWGQAVAADGHGFGERLSLGHVAHDQVSWPVVFPGRYRVELLSADSVLAGPIDVDVKAGETVEARFP
ncbi:MAG TPA: carboxypeptidase-like regulatory domain-containing protein [Planctomycetota bacterium]|nr:carboxypeptidase-like regulatory domain-containing protein [Planctomycetota bacterium]